MDPKLIKKQMYAFLESESTQWVNEGLLNEALQEQILARYQKDPTSQFIKSLVLIGALLIGVGILSFIASNWPYLNKVSKLAIIILSMLSSGFSGLIVMPRSPKTGRALVILSTLIYGAGIFLIGQMFHFSSGFPNAFLLWAIGILPLAFIQKDALLMAGFTLLLTIHTVGYETEFSRVAYWSFPLLYIPFRDAYQRKLSPAYFINALALVIMSLTVFSHFEVDALYTAAIYFACGVLLVFKFHQPQIEHFIGTLLYGIAGLIITTPDLWSIHQWHFESGAIIFGIALGLFLLWQIRQGVILGIVFTCFLILRYYLDLTYDFLPKSLFFIVGGLILLGFGYWFERERRKGGITNESNQDTHA